MSIGPCSLCNYDFHEWVSQLVPCKQTSSVSYFYYSTLNGLSHIQQAVPCYTGLWCPMLQWSVVSHVIMVCPILQQAVPYSRLQKERDSGYGGGTSEAAHYTAL